MSFTSTKSERAALAKSTTSTTFFQQASAQIALESTGRFAAQERAAKPTVAGTESFVRYPGGASWTCDAHPTEPPLGYSVEEMQPVGEAHEIERATAVTAPFPAVRLGGEDVVREPPEPASPPSPAAAHERLAELLPRITIRRRPLR